MSIKASPCGHPDFSEFLFVIVDVEAFNRVIRIFLATGLGPIAEKDVVAI